MAGRWAPFQSIPSVAPPSGYVRLSDLTLNGILFITTTELARLIDNFPTLERCTCHHLTFLDPSPVVQSRRIHRRASLALRRCMISRCKDMTVSTQAALAADVLAVARRIGVDNRTWDATLQALLALVPYAFERANVWLEHQNGSALADTATIYCSSPGQGQSEGDDVRIDVRVRRPSTGQDAGSLLAHVEEIALNLSFADVETVDTLPWDALQAIVDSPHMRRLLITCYTLPSLMQARKTSKRILCSVLRRTQLAWALESGKLQFQTFKPNPFTSEDILSIPTGHTIDGTTIALDITEQAEWLLHSDNPYDPRNSRKEYLRQLVAARAGRESTDTVPETAPSTADGPQNTAGEQSSEAMEVVMPDYEHGEGTGDEGCD
ncbi:uncharacterized protein PHACADRAFT_198921 [Phanerochaete carnosa HHB-10118-sp]|uniref:Uncharacterized protein n=1 Tax=Phanerochaete carnosa (strain HHB-10118-sp) TaxID=650164 RepID=K5WR91_PHACS|nr:uncharacterized protein PHACADRAFT_198921 [Phanerochaete carnosa HHB-10118-sp]EKM52872.1 hypothetical protein PHACADRAFT_198921 [Phanerochaete carnosa HHB-10118-sp]